jgi:hypothetical protein
VFSLEIARLPLLDNLVDAQTFLRKFPREAFVRVVGESLADKSIWVEVVSKATDNESTILLDTSRVMKQTLRDIVFNKNGRRVFIATNRDALGKAWAQEVRTHRSPDPSIDKPLRAQRDARERSRSASVRGQKVCCDCGNEVQSLNGPQFTCRLCKLPRHKSCKLKNGAACAQCSREAQE